MNNVCLGSKHSHNLQIEGSVVEDRKVKHDICKRRTSVRSLQCTFLRKVPVGRRSLQMLPAPQRRRVRCSTRAVRRVSAGTPLNDV
jgi:hypothetical protein